MRAHGVPDFPDPQVSGSGGAVTARIAATVHRGSAGGLNPSSPAFKNAQQACRKLSPNGGSQSGGAAAITGPEVRPLTAHTEYRTSPTQAHSAFNLPSGIDQQLPQDASALQACANLQPNNLSITMARDSVIMHSPAVLLTTRAALNRSTLGSPGRAITAAALNDTAAADDLQEDEESASGLKLAQRPEEIRAARAE